MAVWQEHGSGPHIPTAPKHVQMPVRVTSLGFILQEQLFSPFYFSNCFLFLVLLFNKTSVLSHCVMQRILPVDKNKVRREAEKRTVDASWYCMVYVHWSCLQTSVKWSSCAPEVEGEMFLISFFECPPQSFIIFDCPTANVVINVLKEILLALTFTSSPPLDNFQLVWIRLTIFGFSTDPPSHPSER